MYVAILISAGCYCVCVKVGYESNGNRYFPFQLLLVHSLIIDIHVGQSCLLHSTHNNNSLYLIMYRLHNSNEIENVYYFMKETSKRNVIIAMIYSIYMYIIHKVMNQLMTTSYVYVSNIIMCRNVDVLQFAYYCYLIIMFASTCIRSEISKFYACNTEYNLYNIQEHSHCIIKGNVQGGGDLFSLIHRWVYLLYRDYG